MQPRRWRAGPKPGKMQRAAKEVDITLSEQDKSEIRASYRNAIDPRQHVKILMELYLASREEIEEALGFTHKEARRPIRRHTDAGRPNTYAKHPIEVKQRIVGLVDVYKRQDLKNAFNGFKEAFKRAYTKCLKTA